MLFSIVTPDCGLIQAQQYCSILLTTMNNVGSKTLNNGVLTALNRLCVFTCLGCCDIEKISNIDIEKKIPVISIFFCRRIIRKKYKTFK